MTAESYSARPIEARLLGYNFEQFRAAMVWLMMASSFFVIIEPAPVDLLFLAVLFLFLGSGLTVTILVLPMIVYLLLYNLGGFISFLEVSNEGKAVMFVITSFYMAVSAVFLAFYVAHDPVPRIAWFKNGYIMGAIIASIVAIASYFDVGGTAATLSPMHRAQGTFKDPNVLSTYIVLPALFMMQDVMLKSPGSRILRYVGLFIVLACLFLSFSRGAWVNFVGAAAVTIVLTFVLTPSAAIRSRIILLTIAGVAAIAVMLAYLITIPEVRDLLMDRLVLLKSYDSGETGRFGTQINSIQYLMERPLGFGPTLFRKIFDSDPHNVYLNAFSSYGWLGGFSYFLLIVSTLIVGFKGMFVRTPWQNSSIVVYAAMVAVMFQGIQIDTDHWRHFYWMLGLVWGLHAASAMYITGKADRPGQPA